MARKPRSQIVGPIVHLCNRAAGGITLFQSCHEYHQVLKVFSQALEKFPVFVYAYCIMPNHWHLLCRARNTAIVSQFMHWFGTTHAARWRHSHETVGRGALYQNRFRSHGVEGAAAFLKTAAYIERNALAAGLTRNPSSWPWTSASNPTNLALAPWPVAKPPHWQKFLANPLDNETIREIRWSQLSGQIFQATGPNDNSKA